MCISVYFVFAVIDTVTLNTPANNTFDIDGNITFNCTAAFAASPLVNLSNITLYGNWSGGWHANLTNITVDGALNRTTFVITSSIPDGSYLWNCLATDNSIATNWSSTGNFTIKVDSTSPVTTSTSPANSAEDNDGTVEFVYTVTDATGEIDNCSLWLDGALNMTNLTITESTSQNFTVTNVVEEDVMSWFVSCRDNSSHVGNSTTIYLDTKPTTYTPTPESPGGSYNGQTYSEGQLEGMDLTLSGLRAKDNIGFTFSGENHNAKITTVAANYVMVEVSSDTITAQIDVGEEELFDIDGDGINDLSMTLNSILNNKADITLKQYSSEPIDTTICTERWSCGEWSACVDGEKTRDCSEMNGCSTQNNKPSETESCDVAVDSTVDAGEEGAGGGSYVWVWIIVVVAIAIVLYFVLTNKKKK